jgi:pimeloyl-ACP methyl ester carboxylesterase
MPAEIWRHQLHHFASTHRVVAFDPRGQGRSDKPTYGYQPARRALDIGELLEHLGGEPAVVVGWSIAMQEVLVLAHELGTEAIRAFVLVDHPIEFDAEELTSRFISLQVEREEWTREFIRVIHRSPQSDEYLEAMTQAALSMPTNAAAIMIANLILTGPTDLRPALDSLDRPAIFIASSRIGPWSRPKWFAKDGPRYMSRLSTRPRMLFSWTNQRSSCIQSRLMVLWPDHGSGGLRQGRRMGPPGAPRSA